MLLSLLLVLSGGVLSPGQADDTTRGIVDDAYRGKEQFKQDAHDVKENVKGSAREFQVGAGAGADAAGGAQQ